MRRPSLLTTVAACLLAGMAMGTADAKPKGKRPAVQRVQIKAPTVKRPVKAAATAAVATTIAAAAAPALTAERLSPAQGGLGLGLIEQLTAAKDAPPNVAVSPASIAAVLSLLDLGAGDDMRKALHKTIGLGADKGDATADFEALRKAIAPLMAGEDAPLTGASALVFSPQAQPFPLAVMGLKAAGAEVSVEDLGDQATLDRINGFVSKATKGQIPTILDKAPSGAGLVALNALHFKDAWEMPFKASETKDGAFNLPDKKTVTVPMMHSDAIDVPSRKDDKFVAVRLPYKTKGYSLVLLTTAGGASAPKDFRPALAWLSGESFRKGPVRVIMPRFALSASNDLLAPLDKLGLSPARRNLKSLAGLSPSPQAIDKIVQKAVLKVDEKGTEAAAATAVVTQRNIPSDLTFDRPFLFALQHEDSGLVLMAGYVGDPSRSE